MKLLKRVTKTANSRWNESRIAKQDSKKFPRIVETANGKPANGEGCLYKGHGISKSTVHHYLNETLRATAYKRAKIPKLTPKNRGKSHGLCNERINWGCRGMETSLVE